MIKTSYGTGLSAEALCRLALRLKFYRIIASRYRSPLGEIDIIAMRGKTVALVEVKARASAREAVEAILPRQQARVANAARDFLAHYPRLNGHNIRFDIMVVTPRRWPQHIADAWRPES